MSGNTLSLKDELLLLSSINKHRNSRLQKRSSYLEESSSVNDSNNKPCELQSRDDDTYFDVDDNSIVTEQVSCYRRSSRNGGRPSSSTLKSNCTEPPSLQSTASIRKTTQENYSSGKDRDSPETIRTEFISAPRSPATDTSIHQRNVNNYSPISIQTETVSSRVHSNHKKSIENRQEDSDHGTESSIRHIKKTPSISSSSTKQKSKSSRSFFTRGKKSTSRDKKVVNNRKNKKKQSQASSKGIQLELNKKSQQSSTMQRKISDRYLKSNVDRDIVSIKEEEEVDDKVLMKIPPNKVAVDTSPSATTRAEEVNIVVKQQNKTSKKPLDTYRTAVAANVAQVKVTEQKKQEAEQQLTIYQKNTVSNKNEKDTQLKADKLREQKEIEYRKCLETALSIANMETKQAKRKEEELVKQLTQQIKAKEIEIAKQQAKAEIEKQRSIADELKRKETAQQLKQQIMQLESSLANQNKVLSENEHADLKREVERIVQEEILRVNTESRNELVDDDPDTSDEQPVETNLTTYTSYELEPSIVHNMSNDDSGGCFGWLCCSGGEEKLDKSSWYDAESIDEEELPTGQCDSELDASSVSDCSEGVQHEAHDGSLGIRAV